jgi:hypothetical protein
MKFRLSLIYVKFLSLYPLNANDDFIENVAGASAVGMQALHFNDPQAAQRELAQITGVE